MAKRIVVELIILAAAFVTNYDKLFPVPYQPNCSASGTSHATFTFDGNYPYLCTVEAHAKGKINGNEGSHTLWIEVNGKACGKPANVNRNDHQDGFSSRTTCTYPSKKGEEVTFQAKVNDSSNTQTNSVCNVSEQVRHSAFSSYGWFQRSV